MADAKNRPALRADAEHNREHILEVARTVLAAAPTASLNSIAKTAQVGPGTLYRHFANREALVLAVYRLEIQQLVDSAPTLIEQHPPLDALRLWFERLARDLRIKHGLGDALNPAENESVTRETYGPVITAINMLLRTCETAGVIRHDISAEDILLLMGFMSRAEAGPTGEARVKRLLTLVLDGLQVGGGIKAQPS